MSYVEQGCNWLHSGPNVRKHSLNSWVGPQVELPRETPQGSIWRTQTWTVDVELCSPTTLRINRAQKTYAPAEFAYQEKICHHHIVCFQLPLILLLHWHTVNYPYPVSNLLAFSFSGLSCCGPEALWHSEAAIARTIIKQSHPMVSLRFKRSAALQRSRLSTVP